MLTLLSADFHPLQTRMSPEWHFQLLVVRAERMADAARSGLLFPERLGYD